MTYTYPITLDIYSANSTYRAKQNDAGSRYILATITANGVAQSVPETATVSLKVEKADGTRTLTAGTVSEGKILVELTNQTLAVAGTAICELQIVESEPTSLLKTVRFYLNNDAEVYSDEVIESTDEFTALTEALAEVNEFKNDIATLEENQGTMADLTTTADTLVGAINELDSEKEDKSNKVTSISGASTDIQYPSAKLTYDQLALKEPNLPVTPLLPTEKFLNGNKEWAVPAHNKLTDLNTDAEYQHMTSTEQSKLTNIEENAEVNIIETVSIDGADITPDANRNIDIPLATSTNDGAMSSEYAGKLDGIAENANNYSHPNHSGDVLSTGDGATVIDNNKVTNAKLANMPTMTLKGNNTGATANAADLTVAETKALLDIDDIELELGTLRDLLDYSEADILGLEADFTTSTFNRLAGARNLTAGADFNSFPMYNRRRCNLADNGTVNAYYGEAGYVEDGSNGQVMVEQLPFYYKAIPINYEVNNAVEINTVKITATATDTGDITITLAGTPFTVGVTSGDTASVIAEKIRGTTFTGWTVTGATDSAIFTNNTVGYVETATFSGGTTGVTATVTATQKGYLGKGYKLRKARYYVTANSTYTKYGFEIHPAFVKNTAQVSKIYLSAYEGCAWDTSGSVYFKADEQSVDFTALTGDKLSSIATAKPLSGLVQQATRRNCGIIAENRGIGWSQQYCATVSATQMLFIIEYASFNSQTVIGRGVTDKASGTGNESEITGSTTLLGNASGMAAGTNGLVSVTYRGEENFWGNIWKFTDGMNIYCDIANSVHELYVADNTFAESTQSAPYANAGITLATKDGYVSAMAYSDTYDWLFVPAETLGDSALPVGDYFYQTAASNGYKIALLGGFWNSSSNAGAFYWHVYGIPSYRSRFIGGRLVYVA